jgi:hypothetical protein
MAILNPPGWLQNAGATHTALQFRQYHSLFHAGNSSVGAASLHGRGGVHPTLGGELAVTQAGSPNMTVLVDSGVCTIAGTEGSTQGSYIATNDASATLAVTAAHGSLPRIDIVVVNIRDSFYSGGSNDAQLQVIAGTAAASPVAPSPPANALILAQIAVGAGVTSIVNANITDMRDYFAAAGGVINVRNLSVAPSTTLIASGQLLWSMAGASLHVHSAGVNNQIYPGYNKIAESILGSPAASVTFSSIPSTWRHLELVISARGDTAATLTAMSLRFNADSGANYDAQQLAGNAAITAAGEFINPTSAQIGECAANTASAGAAGIATVFIPFYAGTAFWKLFTSSHQLRNGTGTTTIHTKHWAGTWRNTAAITSVQILPGAGNFNTGSSFALYGKP